MPTKRYETFEEFWPFYVREHSQKTNRALHFVGTTAAMSCALGFALTRKPWLLALMPVVGYGPAWIGHFFVEKNRPATFDYPAWSLFADLVMWSKTLAGTMDVELERAQNVATTPREDASEDASDAPASSEAPRRGANGAAHA